MSNCKFCDAPIFWHRVDGKWQPSNADASPHFCKSKKVRAYDVNHEPGKTIIGARYEALYAQMCNPRCDVLPWDECACTRKLMEAA